MDEQIATNNGRELKASTAAEAVQQIDFVKRQIRQLETFKDAKQSIDERAKALAITKLDEAQLWLTRI